MNIKSMLLLVTGSFARVPAHVMRWVSTVGVVTALATASIAQTSHANSAPEGGKQAGGQPQKPFTISEDIRFDAARHGPLLQVSSPAYWPLGLADTPPDGASVSANADKLKLRVVSVGSLTVLAPTSMYVIEEHPGKPDPYSGLRPEERLKVLISLLNSDQWRKAGSADGIGAGDLNDQEQRLFFSLLPDKVVVQRVKLSQGDQPCSTVSDNQGDPQEFAPSDVHLRLVRKVQFGLMKPGTKDFSDYGGPMPQPGDELTQLKGTLRSDVIDPTVLTAYGVPIMTVAPNRLKPGQLDFAAPALQISIPIDDSIKTLGDLLVQVARATGLDLVADRRLAKYPIAWRATPGQSVRAGDVLKALCWSVTGAFRKLIEPGGTPVYLLTDDVHGIGARIARLNDWAEAAWLARYNAMSNLVDTTTKNDPLSHVQFAPEDPLALPPALLQRVDTAYRSDRDADGLEVAPSDLPPTLQETFQQEVQFAADHGGAVRQDRLYLGTRLKVEYKLPGNLVADAPYSDNLERWYLSSMAALPKTTLPVGNTGSEAAAPPAALPHSLIRRVVLAQLPEQNKALTDLLAAAKGAGFTEIWLQVMINDPVAPGRLSRAVAAGNRLGIGVGCAVSLLREGGMPGEEDINILGETGAEFAARKIAEDPGAARLYRRLGGWQRMEPQKAARLLVPLARVPGMSALTLRATAAPGWAGEKPGGGGIVYSGYLGYGVAARLACIRSQGYDPIDVAAYPDALGALRVPLEPPMFPSNNGSGISHDILQDLCDYRLRENYQGLGAIYAALRRNAPDLPLYLGDRPSAYKDTHFSWYSLWDAAEHIPVNANSADESEVLKAAYAVSPEPLRNYNASNGDPIELARAIDNTAQDAAKHWRGLTLDLVEMKPSDALRMLKGLQSLYARTVSQ